MNLNHKIGIGTVQFGMDYGISNKEGITNQDEVSAILTFSKKVGIKYIDTANAYGSSEISLGKENLHEFKVVSKFMPEVGIKTIVAQLDESLKNLNLTSIYGYLAHRPTTLIEDPKQWDELQKLKNNGLIKKIGFSLNEPNELENLLENGFIPDLIQVPFNYFDNRFKNILIQIKKNGCEIHARSTFLQGLFFMDTNELSYFFDEVKKEIRNLQLSYKNLPGSLLKYVLSMDFIDVAIIGCQNKSQLKVNINDLYNNQELPLKDFNFSKKILVPSNWPK